ncbi:MAG TPA: fibronectin type III domain-containing protein [Pyrinomonadaceae bacterium]|nr:fibronectin type III domain-containing protein [Pyrinomonadaceae bacterium]
MRQSLPSKYILQLLVTITWLTLVSSVFAQPSQALIENWRAADFNFNSTMLDNDPAGNLYVLGDTPATNILVIKKFSVTGNLLWQTTYDPMDSLRGAWLTVDGGGNVIVLASIVRAVDGEPHGWLTIKYDTNGNLLWANSLPGPFRGAIRVEVDAHNNIYVAGYMWLTNASANTTHDSVLIKYSPSGTTLWTAVFDNNGAIDKPHAMNISPDGSRVGVAGISGNLFMALMYDANGKLLWANTNLKAYAANDVAFGPENVSYFATGTYSPLDSAPYQMAIAKFNTAGTPLWTRSYSVGQRTYRLRIDSGGNVVATGITPAGYFDWMTIKTDANGNLMWSQRFNGSESNFETPNMLVLDASDAVYVTGTGGPNPSTGMISYLKGVIAKYRSDGTPQWAVSDPYANGKAIALGAGNTLASVGFGYLVTAHYNETGVVDLPPAAPTDLRAFAGTSYVNLYFVDNASNEFRVEVERCQGSGCANFSKIGHTLGENSSGFRDSNVLRDTTYTYRARAVGFMGASDYSNTVEVTLSPLSPPAAPINLTAALSGGYVVLNWQDVSTNEIQFYVERCQGTGCVSFIGVGASGANITTWTDYNAAAGQSYTYRVRAWNSDGYSGYSNNAAIVPPGEIPAQPTAPSNLAGQALNKSQIILSWTNNSTNQDGVKIERCKGSNCTNFTQITIVGGTATAYTDYGLAAGTSYRYRVRVYNSAGNSQYSNIATAKTLRK